MIQFWKFVAIKVCVKYCQLIWVIFYFLFLSFFLSFLVCLESNHFVDTRIEFEDAKIQPCRYRKVKTDIKSVCNPFSFGELADTRFLDFRETTFTVHESKADWDIRKNERLKQFKTLGDVLRTPSDSFQMILFSVIEPF